MTAKTLFTAADGSLNLPDWATDRDPEWLKLMQTLAEDHSDEKVEWVLSCDAEHINSFLGFRHGINTGLTLAQFCKVSADSVSYRRRRGLETNPGQRHLISYDLVVFRRKGKLVVLKYARTKASGEGRLVSGHSIGIGGHLEIEDHVALFANSNNVQLLESIRDGILRERVEELRLFTTADSVFMKDADAHALLEPINFVGLLCDNEDPKKTGDYHVGLISVVFLPDGVEAVTRDASNQFVCAEPLEDALQDPKLERWSVMMAQWLLKVEGRLESIVAQSDVAVTSEA